MNDGLDVLLVTDPARLSHDERLDLLDSIERAKAALDAHAQHVLHLLSREGDAEQRAREWVREEIACVLRLAPVTAGDRLHDATDLVTRLPATLAKLADGSITMLHARSLVDAVGFLDDTTTTKIEARVLARAGQQTVGEFRRSLKRAVLACDPRHADAQHADALTQRRVRLFADEHGMATVWAYLRADDAMRLITCMDAHAAALEDPSDERTMDHKRADVLADLAALALQNAPVTWQGRKPAVQVSVALSTLIGADQQPGELDGYGPVPAALARAIASDPTGTWRRLITDPAGHLVDYEQTTYRAPAALREHVIAEAKTCTFPGCRRTARRNQLDHLHEWSNGGHTSGVNLHPPCLRHHLTRHDGRWQVHRHSEGSDQPAAGTITWTTPTRRQFHRPPATYPLDTTSAATNTDSDPPPF